MRLWIVEPKCCWPPGWMMSAPLVLDIDDGKRGKVSDTAAMAEALQEARRGCLPHMTSPLFDSHCHLLDERLPGSLELVLQEAAASGVQQLACNGCCEEDWGRVAAAAQRHPAIVPNFGLHPWWVPRRSPKWLQQLRALLEAHPHAGLGECGLDHGPRAPEVDWAVQVEAFELQLQLAQELQRAVSIHCVRAFGAVHDSLRCLHVTVPVVLHSWMGAAAMTTALLQLPNVYVSLSGHLTKLAPQKALPMVRAVPLDRLLLESDSPNGVLDLSPVWLEALPALAHLPQQLRDAGLHQLSRPCMLRWTLQLLAAALDRPEEEVAAATFANARRIFCSGSSGGGSGGSSSLGVAPQ